MVKNHKADSFDGGRAASIRAEPDPVRVPDLRRKVLPGGNEHPDDDDVRALLLAVIALASADE
jgi:hypothetical protein